MTEPTKRYEILLGGTNEQKFGLARAVRVGRFICVGGTAPIAQDGTNIDPGDFVAQVTRCYEIIGAALAKAGASSKDVTRTRTMLVRMEDAPAAIAARLAFLKGTMSVDTIVQVSGFVDPDWLVEIEADAIVAGDE